MSLTDTIKNIFVAPDEGSDYEEETQLNEEELEEEQGWEYTDEQKIRPWLP